ncbi:hypothetical protein ACLOJK_013801 [Asimina triloba]
MTQQLHDPCLDQQSTAYATGCFITICFSVNDGWASAQWHEEYDPSLGQQLIHGHPYVLNALIPGGPCHLRDGTHTTSLAADDHDHGHLSHFSVCTCTGAFTILNHKP